ncbi:hypothetical protein [Chitinophaga pinensis]|uniref:Uncharacterized protein n=1 Tax=Chitinophaga pinensis TaxID=79329 RepID=A0A5C6LPG7_9BACT|nr:hypothetical protein [Chitinophaga pinensis]TWV99190.1 hypothetical protein FEF09_18150 [Chitinophaga pinensis]
MRKSIYTLLSLLIAAFLIIVILVWTAPSPNKQPNGFNRHYLQSSPLTTITTIPADNILDIAGADDSLFYFSVLRQPAMIITTSLKPGAVTDTFYIPLRPSFRDAVSEYFFTQVSNNNCFVFGYNIPAICRTGRKDSSTQLFTTLPAGGFSQGYLLRDEKHFVLRKLHIQEKDQLFVRTDFESDSLLMENGLSELHRDGGMSTDGTLTYDRSTGLFTYIHFYSNRFFTFDSTLQRLSSYHTIDTFAVSRFAAAGIQDKDKQVYTNAGPDQMINGFSCADKGILYVQGKLKADNETNEMFAEHCVIDLYAISSGKYLGSFYLDIPARTKVNQLFVQGNKLVVHCADKIYAIQLAHS